LETETQIVRWQKEHAAECQGLAENPYCTTNCGVLLPFIPADNGAGRPAPLTTIPPARRQHKAAEPHCSTCFSRVRMPVDLYGLMLGSNVRSETIEAGVRQYHRHQAIAQTYRRQDVRHF